MSVSSFSARCRAIATSGWEDSRSRKRHDPILCGSDPGIERAGEIIAADVHEVPAFLLDSGFAAPSG